MFAKLREAVRRDYSKSRKLWPGRRKRPGVVYETDETYHGGYDRGLAATQMEASDSPMRRQRYYTFPHLLRSVADLPGDVCETGCYRGLSAYLIARTLQQIGKQRRLHLCDSFEGLSVFQEADKALHHDMNTPEKRRKYICSLDVVQNNLREFDFIEYHKGWIPEPFRDLEEAQFCFVHIDVDLYEPTRESFEFLYPRLVPNGVMVFDDYGTLKFPGARKAIDECLGRVDHVFFTALPSGQAFLVKRAG